MSSPISLAAMMAYRSKIRDQQDLFPSFLWSVPSIILQMTSSLGPLQITLLETPARPIHHNAVMLVETLHRASQRQQMHRGGQANEKHEFESYRVATIDTWRVTFIEGDEPTCCSGLRGK
jgi:hypothetical protein